jgi:hypothetical protein
MSGVIVGIAAFGIALFVLDCWTALVPPRGFHALPGWARLLLPLTFAAAALRESNRGQRSVFVALAVTFVLILYRERFGYAFWIHPVIWTCCGYLIFTGANGNAPAPLETNRVVWSAVAVIVAFVEVFLAQLFAVR